MRSLIPHCRPALVLAPMQDVTDLPFMRVIARRGAPDWFVTEYFRVHPNSHLNSYILRSILENETGRPVFAQVIGSDLDSLVRAAKVLATLPVAGIDLNLGCPAPIVCRKNAGGGLLRHPAVLPSLLAALREATSGRFTVKTRLGFTDVNEFPALLEIFRNAGIDGLTVHGRTVQERYQSPVHPDCLKMAVETMPCPVIANGNVVDITTAIDLLHQSQAAGLMIGRGAIRNPWIFAQLRVAFAGGEWILPTRRDLHTYVLELYDELARETRRFVPCAHVQRMKKTLAYISHGLEGEFEREMRRAKTPDDFVRICRSHLEDDTLLPVRPPEGSKLFCGFESLVP